MARRDIGTVVLPQANLKVFLVASPEERANRRHREKRGLPGVSYEQMLSELKSRDAIDSTRVLSPTVPAHDARILDTEASPPNKSPTRYSPWQRRSVELNVYDCTRPFAAVALRFLCHYEYRNRKRKLPDGPLIIVSNHLSWFDIPLIGIAVPRQIAFMAKKEYFHSPFHRRLVDLYGGFTVERGAVDGTALKKAFEVLDGGRCLGIFPEGTRSKSLQLQQGHVGTAFIALHKKLTYCPSAYQEPRRSGSSSRASPTSSIDQRSS